MLEGGMQALLISTVVLMLCHVVALAQIIITEVHPTPSSGEPEWIECINIGQRAVAVRSWYVCDSRSCTDLPDVTIEAGGILVVTSDAEALAESRVVARNVLVVQCRLPSLNNTVDRVELRNADSAVADSMTYDVRRHVRGRSIERCGHWSGGRVVYGSEWAASMRRDSASCGLLNSCVVLPHDVAVESLVVGDTTVTVVMINAGSETSSGRRYDIEIGATRDGGDLPVLVPRLRFEHEIDRSLLGRRDTVHSVMVRVVIHGADDRPDNDTVEDVITIPPFAASVTISEVMAEPDERQTEYVEIWNGTPVRVDLTGWSIEDASGRRCVIQPPAIVPAGGYLAICADTGIGAMSSVGPWTLMRPTLNVNSTSDTVTLRTPQGMIIDRTPYDDDSHVDILQTRGRSLERRAPWSSSVDVAAWTTSTDPTGGTPGRANSIGRPPPATGGMKSWPDPCSADEASGMYPCFISWQQPIEQGIGRLRIFRLDGVEVAELINGELIGRTGSAVWDVRDATTRLAVAIGAYVAVLECTSLTTPDHHVDRCLINVGQSRFESRKR
jgi:hypothetical protein